MRFRKVFMQVKVAIAKTPILAIFLSLILIFSILSPDVFLNPFNIENIFRQASFDSIVALGMTFVLIGGGIDISVGMVMAMSAALTIGLQPYGVFVAIIAALLFGLCVGVINGFLVTKLKIIAFITTLGMMTVIQGLLLLYTHQQPISGQISWFPEIGNGNLWVIPYPILIFAVVAVFFHLLLTYTRFGRNILTAGGNQEACRLAGINPGKHIKFTFIFSSVLASLAGVLLASRLNCATIHIGGETALLAVAASIMGGASMSGGRGSVFGTFLGVLSLQIVSNGMNLLGVFTYYQYAIKALILITVVIVDGYYSKKRNEIKNISTGSKTPVLAPN